ncbi:MAG TPA: ceramidase domain-containing protein [Saprospiraceae bacterium]|nr:ceramidase domain-containing protein [Saprospiraceae bacterium]
MTFSPITLIGSLLLLAAVGMGMAAPIPQDPMYHDYGDQRIIFGIPYFWNVVSNLPMFFIGLYGLREAIRRYTERPEGVARLIPLVLSGGIYITCFGSAYYHWKPSNDTLLWDRLPMTLMFMSLFSLLVYDYLGKKAGTIAFWTSIPAGIISVLYWHFTEAAGQGDLRPYAIVQFFPMVAAPALMLVYPGKVPYVKLVAYILGWYVVAKLFEHFDKEVYQMLGFWSGHTLKHLTGAIGLVYAMKVVDGWNPSANKA